MLDCYEFENATDPNKDDADGDGLDDITELTNDYGSSPIGSDGISPSINWFDASYEIRSSLKWEMTHFY